MRVIFDHVRLSGRIMPVMQVIEAQSARSWGLTITSITNMSANSQVVRGAPAETRPGLACRTSRTLRVRLGREQRGADTAARAFGITISSWSSAATGSFRWPYSGMGRVSPSSGSAVVPKAIRPRGGQLFLPGGFRICVCVCRCRVCARGCHVPGRSRSDRGRR